MALKVIGAGWGRTGTESLRTALEILGYAKCYHMFALLKNSKQVAHWEQLHRKERPNYDDLFKGYLATVDFPGAMHYQELMQQYPDAKVILTVRDADLWYASAAKTIFRPLPGAVRAVPSIFGFFSANLRGLGRLFRYLDAVLFADFLENKMRDAAHMKKRFIAWNDEVKRKVPAEKLLVYEVQEGWGPLCKFLGVPVPDVPFPTANNSNDFANRVKPINIVKALWNSSKSKSKPLSS